MQKESLFSIIIINYGWHHEIYLFQLRKMYYKGETASFTENGNRCVIFSYHVNLTALLFSLSTTCTKLSSFQDANASDLEKKEK